MELIQLVQWLFAAKNQQEQLLLLDEVQEQDELEFALHVIRITGAENWNNSQQGEVTFRSKTALTTNYLWLI